MSSICVYCPSKSLSLSTMQPSYASCTADFPCRFTVRPWISRISSSTDVSPLIRESTTCGSSCFWCARHNCSNARCCAEEHVDYAVHNERVSLFISLSAVRIGAGVDWLPSGTKLSLTNSLSQGRGNPLCVFHIALATGQLFKKLGVDQMKLEI